MNMKDAFNNHVNERRDENYAALVVNTKPQRRIPEVEFLRNFYAFFRGEVKDTNDARAVLRNWITVAGSQFDEVQIYDGAGRDLYIVPSIATSDAVRTVVRESRGLKFNAIPADAHNAKMAADTPMHEQTMLLNSLSKNIVEDEQAVIAHKGKWDALIAFFDARLGLTPIAKDAGNSASGKSSADLHDELF